ncbi:hypothetical protein [Novosphingobium profundi]|uniref:hypothetical protein n=1 Tax=Novosphingobium profundi TaxID=1774954 RepID=UPI001CFEA224|nr:hypothetical protein [Novosphingobium profundi]
MALGMSFPASIFTFWGKSLEVPRFSGKCLRRARRQEARNEKAASSWARLLNGSAETGAQFGGYFLVSCQRESKRAFTAQGLANPDTLVFAVVAQILEVFV